MLRIGVVCEGQTDFVAIKIFLEDEFLRQGRNVIFDMIQPAYDNSLPSGWPQVLLWIENNELSFRSALYLKGDSLFAIEDEESKYDALLFQIDSDIIGEAGFEAFIKKRNLSYAPPHTNVDRGNVIRHVLLSIGGHASDAVSLSHKEVMAPTVESSEAWLLAAENVAGHPESLIGQPLIDAFGALVARSSGQAPKASYTNINKATKTRKRICKLIVKTSSPTGRSHHYDEVVHKIASL
jgi:hypothetical protein